jgi:hypothetical protein
MSKSTTIDKQSIKIIPNVAFLKTLQSSGYNNYTAIADIVDNSLDSEVEATLVNINIKANTKEGKLSYDYIQISDNGNGMDTTTATECFKLGAETGKSRKNDLGSYGTGLKAAGLSLGRCITVKTKSHHDAFIVLTFDLDSIISTGEFAIPMYYGSEEEYSEFKSITNSDTGTVVTISNIENITSGNLSQFKDTLRKKFSLFYKNFIDEKGVVIKINGDVIESFDPMHRQKPFVKHLSSLNETFKYAEKEYRFNAYYIESVSNMDKTIKDDVGRNNYNAGLYVYRNLRLVGSGLDLGIINKHGDGYLNGLRIELFIDGDDDNLFGSTFMKMINEKDKNELNQGFRDKCHSALKPYITTVKVFDRQNGEGDKTSVETKKEFDNIIQSINGNKLVNIPKAKPSSNTITLTKGTPPAVNKARTTRKREDDFAKWEYVSLGEAGKLFNLTKEQGKYVVHINVDHVFWSEFLCKATNDTKANVAKLLVAMGMSLDSVSFYDDAEKEVLLNEYFLQVSTNLRQLIVG